MGMMDKFPNSKIVIFSQCEVKETIFEKWEMLCQLYDPVMDAPDSSKFSSLWTTLLEFFNLIAELNLIKKDILNEKKYTEIICLFFSQNKDCENQLIWNYTLHSLALLLDSRNVFDITLFKGILTLIADDLKKTKLSNFSSFNFLLNLAHSYSHNEDLLYDFMESVSSIIPCLPSCIIKI
jgi:hypothetical protein